jgi:hypothetical protein
MSGITSIKRDQAYDPFIVRIIADSTLSQVGTTGYLTAQAANIEAINEGPWEWALSDMVLVYATDGWGFFQIDPGFASLIPFVFGGSVVGAPVTIGDFAVFQSTSGNLEDLGYLPSDASKTRVVMAGSATQVGYIAHFTDTHGTVDDTAGAVQNDGNIQAGKSGTAGTLISFPATGSKGSLILAAVANTGNTNTTISNAAMGQASVVSIPDPGASTANFVLDAGTASAISVNNLKYGATPVAQVDPGSCTITAAAGAANTCTITVQLKDGSGTNMSRVIPFKVYLATDNTGLTLQSAASTGYSVASGGVKDPTGSTTITQGIAAFSSATGGCVLSLLDTGKGTGNLILMLPNGFKASAAVTSGSYG